MRVRTLEGIDAVRPIRAIWNDLAREQCQGVVGVDFSATFEWIDALCHAHFPGADLRTAVVEDGDAIVGLLPTIRSVVPFASMNARLVAPAQDVYSTRYGFLVRDMNPDYVKALLTHALAERPNWDLFRIRLVDHGLSFDAFDSVRKEVGLEPRALETAARPYCELGVDWEQFEARLKNKFRRDLERQERRLREMGNLECRMYETPGEVAQFMEAMLHIEAESWKAAKGTQMKAGSVEGRFWNRLLASAAESGCFSGSVLFLDSRPVAHWMGLVYGGTYSPYKTSYVEGFGRQGLGQVLMRLIVRHLCERGVPRIDFLGNPQDYIRRWGTTEYSETTYVAFSRSLRGRLLSVGTTLRERMRSHGSGGK